MAVAVRAVLAYGSDVRAPVDRLRRLFRNELLLRAILLLAGRARERPRIGGFEVDNVAKEDLPLVQLVAPDDDSLEGERAFAKPADHGFAAGFDAFCDRDFAFARQKLHRAHFAQIHADGIVGALANLGGPLLLDGQMRGGRLPVFLLIVDRLGGGGFLDLFRINNIHAQIGEHRHDVLDLVGRHFIRRQNFVQLVVSDVAARLRNLDETLYGGIQKIKDRAVGRLRSRGLLIVCFCRHCGHYALQKNRKTEQPRIVPRLDVAVNLVWRWNGDVQPAAAGPRRTAAPLQFISGCA